MATCLPTSSKEEKWCAVIAIVNFIIATIGAMFVLSLIIIAAKDHNKPDALQRLSKMEHYLHQNFADMNESFFQAILGTALVFSIAGIAASVFLIIGIKLQKACYLVCYFCFLMVTTILVLISGVLLLVNAHWLPAIFILAATPLCIYSMVIVYKAHETMEYNKEFTVFEDNMRLLIEN